MDTNEIWVKLVKGKYPDMSLYLIEEKRIQAVIDWACGSENEFATLYDQFVMLKRLHDINPQDDDK